MWGSMTYKDERMDQMKGKGAGTKEGKKRTIPIAKTEMSKKTRMKEKKTDTHDGRIYRQDLSLLFVEMARGWCCSRCE